MKKILSILIISMIVFAGENKVTTISKKLTKDSLIFVYDVPDKNFKDLQANPMFYKKLLINMLCKKKKAELLVDTFNIVYDYRKHSNNNYKYVIVIKKGSCDIH